MAKHKQPEGLEPGIYFNLHEDKYHADSALSHSGMVDMLVHPYEYWWNGPLNVNRKRKKETDAMKFGKRCHALLLEPDSFFKKFSCTSSRDYSKGKILIPRHEFDDIKESIEMIKRVPSAHAYFQNGMPEVTIVWIDAATGIRLRIRVDYLRTFGGVDYKRSKEIQNNPLGWVIADHGYDIQEYLYKEGISQAKRLLAAGKIKAHGLHDVTWLKKFMDEQTTLFRFFFQRSTKPYVFRILNMDPEIMGVARARAEEAIALYKKNIERYGVAEWPAGNPEPEEFSIYHLPRRIFDQGSN